MCEGNHKSFEQEQNLFASILIEGYRSDYGNDDVDYIPPLVESIENKIIDESLSVDDALRAAFANTERLLQKVFGRNKDDVGAKATVAVIDKQAKEISVATLGDIRTVIIKGKCLLVGPSDKVAVVNVDQTELSKKEKGRMYKALDDYICSRLTRQQKVTYIKNEMAAKGTIFNSPVTRVFGEFGIKNKIKDFVIAVPHVTKTADDARYIVIATDSIWQTVKPAQLENIMTLSLDPKAREQRTTNVLNRNGNKALSNDSNSSYDTVGSYAMNIFLKAVNERNGHEQTSIPDMTAMVIDVRSLHKQ